MPAYAAHQVEARLSTRSNASVAGWCLSLKFDRAPTNPHGMLSATLGGHVTIGEALQFLIENGPGRTEAQLAEAIFGDKGYQQRVNSDCTLLVGKGLIERCGEGGPGDPFRYFPMGATNA